MNEIVEPYLTLSSAAFLDGQHIPEKYTCDGENSNPQLEVGNIPEGTQSLALIMEDPDAPNGTFTHWLIWDMPVLHTIMENEAPGIQGKNDFGENKYGGPCPPDGTHRYYFRLYALSQQLNLPETTSKEELLSAIEPVKLAKAELMGKYNR
ncbi:YbhB/YbcL family Raf kinase inhibitor-like protein [Adhaeribacter sp. BT258]|uniref:YbhB/YbcL family Raf kinase inhibitor-like protein n=1 Tax=Adhaeribacter terrigena TaxID=2793070 RepID=A0ABS1C3Y6_9BACT|nr:YbhB/YbcL family Raf kinase inhibitor-like protein [Adhaeribacter terrigena]MBK0404070.1 YbhB/YbcL family Raf kinase inhibitor-like protein [Adhaeribacter terrigena]